MFVFSLVCGVSTSSGKGAIVMDLVVRFRISVVPLVTLVLVLGHCSLLCLDSFEFANDLFDVVCR